MSQSKPLPGVALLRKYLVDHGENGEPMSKNAFAKKAAAASGAVVDRVTISNLLEQDSNKRVSAVIAFAIECGSDGEVPASSWLPEEMAATVEARTGTE
jgi:hypothetical protein